MAVNRIPLVVLALLFSACALFDDNAPKKPATTGLIATPPSYYSTAKAKYLGAKYKENLDRMVERIVRNPKTSSLQFANNISSVGGIGFFTHSATKSPDERYLEIVLATPETFETKGDVSEKVQQLFSRYGLELLGIISGDGDIYRDKELSGYGLNFAWRNVIADPSGNRIALARAILYFPKERVLNFLRNEINQNDLLSEAVIFAVDEDGPLNLVSYKPQALRPEFRPAIREDDLTNVPVATKQPEPKSPASSKEAGQKIDQKLEVAKKDSPVSAPPAKPIQQEIKAETKRTVAGAQKSSAKPAPSNESVDEAPKQVSSAQRKDAERDASTKRADGNLPSAPANEPKVEAKPDAHRPPAKTAAVAPPTTAMAKPAADVPVEKAAPSIIAKPAPSTEKNVANQKAREIPSEPARAPAAKPVAPLQKPEAAPKPVADSVKPAPSAAAPKAIVEAPRGEKIGADKPSEIIIAKAPEKQPIVERQKEESKTIAAPTLTSKSESPASGPTPSPEVGPRTLPDKIVIAKVSEANKTPPAAVKASKPTRQVESTAVAPSAPEVPAQTGRQQEAPAKSAVKEKVSSAQAREPAAAEPAKNVQVISESKTREAAPRQASVAKAPVPTPAPEQMKAAPAPNVAKVETKPIEIKAAVPAMAAKSKETVTEKPTNEQLALLKKTAEATAERTPPAKPAAQTSPSEPAKPTPAPSVAKAEARPVEVKSAAPAVTTKANESVTGKPASEQLALLNKPSESVAEKKPLTHSARKALEGFIIQLAFHDKDKAQHWAESMERRGYAVSVTEAGTDGALRVRLGNFTLRDEAERQLRNFKQDGLNGIVINLPQAFRPEARSSVP